MSLQKVAQIAGVSTSTVSRVINSYPRVAPRTVESVRRAMRQISFTPTLRRSTGPRAGRGIRTANIAFLVLGASGQQQTAPGFESLLRGVSASCTDHDLDLIFSFVSDPSELPQKVEQRRVDGLLLHGSRPSPEVQKQIESLPTVWLMANRQRPTSGDQVMPDNTLIGEIGARYLLRRGHRRLAYVSGGPSSWSFEVRALSFVRTAQDAGAETFIPESGLTIDGQVQKLTELPEMPTGLFIAEDRLLHDVYAAFEQRRLQIGAGSGIDLISCNNERSHRTGLSVQPAAIDIRVESIGRRGVEQLIWRMSNAGVRERIRFLIEPTLIEP